MTDRLNAWLQLGASVGIVMGLGLVGVQIQQATDIAKAEFLNTSFESTMRSFETVVGEHLANAWSKAMTNSDELTDEDLAVIDAYLRREWLNNVRTEMLAALGYTDTRSSVEKWVFGYLGNETGLRWWRQQQNEVSMAPEFQDAINVTLQAQGEDHHRFHEARLQGLRSGPLYP